MSVIRLALTSRKRLGARIARRTADARSPARSMRRTDRTQSSCRSPTSTMMLSASRAAARTAVSRRAFSTAPKMHKAKGNWEALASKRPIDHDDTHVRAVRIAVKL